MYSANIGHSAFHYYQTLLTGQLFNQSNKQQRKTLRKGNKKFNMDGNIK